MTDTSWKRAERLAANCLGGTRNPLSGSASKHTSGDVIHPELYVEVKYRKRHQACSLMRETVVEAKKERKVPVTMLSEHNAKWGLLCIRTTDLPKFVSILSELYGGPEGEILGELVAEADHQPQPHLPTLTEANKGMKRIGRGRK